MLPVAPRLVSGSSLLPDMTGVLSRDLTGRASLNLPWRTAGLAHTFWSQAGACDLGECQLGNTWVTACPVRWCGTLLLCNVVNRAVSVVQVICMPIWSFYDKTNVVILTCTTDIFPPILPTYQWLLLLIKVRWKGVCSWDCPVLLPGVRYRQRAFYT